MLALQYPAWLRPEIIPGLPFRWYGLMYVVGFAVTWMLFIRESRRREAPWSEDDAAGFFFWAIVGLLAGGRLFGTLVYDTSGLYWAKPWLIFWPFDEGGRFAGFQGMSYHGGFLGLVAATLVYCKVRKSPWLLWADVLAVCAPLGYTAGRLGNFINGELWGKVTASPLGMVFPAVPSSGRFEARFAWVQELAEKAGIRLNSMNDIVNLPRHPSQLYEAIFEGLFLWLVLWFLVRRRKAFPGFATGVYAIGYGTIRFVIEYFREPDAGMGYVIRLGDKAAPIHSFTTLWNFSMGQVLCALMILGGALFLVLAGREARRRAQAPAAAGAGGADPDGAAPSARKARKRIK